MPILKKDKIAFSEGVYEGETLDGKRHGFGQTNYHSGCFHQGEYRHDQRHGYGIYSWKNGNKYEGDFYQNQCQGYGKFSCADGTVYEGEFQQGQQHGYGHTQFSDGNKYFGMWQCGQPHGYGCCETTEGLRYVGMMQQGHMSGDCSLTTRDGVETVRLGQMYNDQGHFFSSRVPDLLSYKETLENTAPVSVAMLPKYRAKRFLTLPPPGTFYSAFFKVSEEYRLIQAQRLRPKPHRLQKKALPKHLGKRKRKQLDNNPSAQKVRQFIELRDLTQQLKVAQDKRAQGELCVICCDATSGEELHKTESEKKHLTCADCAAQLECCPFCKEPIVEDTSRLEMGISRI